MAKETKKFNKNLVMMIVVPVLVMTVTMGIIGVSFAWFNDAEQTTIATLDLSTSETFQMTFEIDQYSQIFDQENQRRYIYAGQTAFDKNGLLVTDVHAREILGYTDVDSRQYKNYMNDQAFVVPFNLRMDTNGYEVDFTCIIESVEVSKEGSEAAGIYLPTNNGTEDDTTDDITVEDIKLGFTWYISAGNTWYTPYGTISATTPTDQSTTIPSMNIADWTKHSLNTDFQATLDQENTDKANFAFNIVFAPEILFWQQYGSLTEYKQTASDVYGSVYKSDKWNAINRYSSQVYSGSTYKFTVLLTVEALREVA